MSGNFRTLKVYQLAYQLAMEIFELSRAFLKEEMNSLTDQIRRSSSRFVQILLSRYEEVGKMLGGMANHPEKFIPK